MNEVKMLRELLMLSQEELALILNVDTGTVSRWERGLRRPRPVHKRRMARLRKEFNNGKNKGSPVSI